MHKTSVIVARTIGTLALAAGAMLFTGCQTEPFTGRSQLLLTSASEETALGLTSWQDTVKKAQISTDRAKIAAVERVGKAVAAVCGQPDFQWEFKVFVSPEANAFCLPGGKVAVYEGLFKYVSNDAELAAVMGHEIGHAIARHGGERMSEAQVVDLGAQGLNAALSTKTAQEKERWMMAYSGLTTVGVMLPYSRTHENSADQIGLVLMSKAGYDPEASTSFWQKFSQASGGKTSALGDFLSTHPLDSKRLEHLRQLMPKAKADYQAAPTRRGLGQTIR